MNAPTNFFTRIAAVSPQLVLGDPQKNSPALSRATLEAVAGGAQIVITPELSLTGYTCGDLFYQPAFLSAAESALNDYLRRTADAEVLSVVGLPIAFGERLFNCAAVCFSGSLLGVVPKTHLPGRSEFYEPRWFASGAGAARSHIRLCGELVPFGTDLLFVSQDVPFPVVGIEICEDLWAVEPPSGRLALAGASLILNPSASPELLAKAAYRRSLVSQQSARCLCAYAYASSGPSESTSDLVYGGHCLIAENGKILAESERFGFAPGQLLADVDIDFLRYERSRNSTFSQTACPGAFREVLLPPSKFRWTGTDLLRPLARTPFVPEDPARREEHCREIFAIQSTGLAARMRATACKKLVLGLSGGLDSTLALLVAIEAAKLTGMRENGILAVSMPGPGSTSGPKKTAAALARALEIDFREIPIHEAVTQHLRAISHPEDRHDVTFENAQARERTQILMDLANQTGGIVVGTGDLSESALGWCTYNGDHMSMYHVNSGVPKTLVRYLVTWCAEEIFSDPVSGLLRRVCETPISPELLPPAEDGSISHQTETIIGPYEVLDFFLFHFLRNGHPPAKILFLATKAFAGTHTKEELSGWLAGFWKRFFASQFKRNTVPDGPKVGSVALSPRADWRMPSDMALPSWLAVQRHEPGTDHPEKARSAS